ncbi:MAG: hypothetical protein KatS3mg022_3680 [Armatimonadota bacterium]|nr:MAG: hypothetical protein KatS3mg022_3680 [Armatimonadota bacterium]
MYLYRHLNEEERRLLVEERRQRGFPPHRPPHPEREAIYYLLTAACYEHRHLMNTVDRREQLLDRLFEQCTQHGIELRAWVVLPNHYHVLAVVPDFSVLPEVFRRVHGATSRQWNIEDNTLGRKVWYQYADRAIRSERHYWATVNYIHYNPIKHGYVRRAREWKVSSIHWYWHSYGEQQLRQWWDAFPIGDYGKGWDE